MPRLKVLDLFSGIGGFSLGLESTGGFETIAFCEIEEFPRKVLKKHWPGVPIHEDIHHVSGYKYKGIDLVCGGFPCQPVSMAGKRKGDKDSRWLWPEFLRVIQEARPRWCLIENVPGLRTKHADEVLADLEGQGYACWPLVVGAVHAGAPHRRQRVWIVAHVERTLRGPFDSPCNRLERQHRISQWEESAGWSGVLGEDWYAPDAAQQLSHGAGACGAGRRELANGGSQWDWSRAPKPVLRGVDDGVPCGMDRTKRLKALGNSVVPQIVRALGCEILWMEMML